jgi:hypothetical protein
MPIFETSLLMLCALGRDRLRCWAPCPFGLLLTQKLGLGNLREIGSGNIGATNVLRTGNKGAAAATLMLDGAKGAVAVLLARAFVGEDAAQLAGLMAFLGHCFPGLAGLQGRQGGGDLPRADAGAGFPGGAGLLSHVARGGGGAAHFLGGRVGGGGAFARLGAGAGGRSQELVAHEAGGADYISLNLYRLSKRCPAQTLRDAGGKGGALRAGA